MALDERRDVRVVRSGEKVFFPVASYDANLGRMEFSERTGRVFARPCLNSKSERSIRVLASGS